MKVLQVVTDDDRRGAQVFATQLGERLADTDHTTTVALAAGADGGLDLEILGSARRSPATLAALRDRMAAADVTVAHGSATLLACAVAGAGPGRPFVYRQISDPVFWTPTTSKRLRTGWCYRRATHVVALSERSAAVVRQRFSVPRERVSVIPNAVDERRFPPATPASSAEARRTIRLDDDAAVVAYAGALVAEKGVADLIAAVAGAAGPRGPVTLLVAGDGPERAALEHAATTAGVDARFVGAVTDPARVYAAADVVVLPSRGGDSQPAVLIEAALVGRPCIAAAVGSIDEVVLDGRTGTLVPPGDVAALRRAITELLADAARARALGAAARQHALSEFALDQVADRWRAVLGRAAAPGRASPTAPAHAPPTPVDAATPSRPARRGRRPVSASVIIPLYQGAATIGEQLAALAAQDDPGVPWEVVVADNGSTDGGPELVRRWSAAPVPVRVVAAAAVRGASHARNVAARVATGELLCFCDADDIVQPGWLRAHVEAAADHDFAGGPLEVDSLNDPRKRAWRPEPEPAVGRGPASFAPSSNLAFWADRFWSVDGFDEAFLKSHDVELSRRAIDAGLRFGWVESAVVAYRLRTTLRSLARQSFRAGRFSHRMHVVHGDAGDRRSGRSVAGAWAAALVRVPYLASSRRRGIVVRMLAFEAGFLVETGAGMAGRRSRAGR